MLERRVPNVADAEAAIGLNGALEAHVALGGGLVAVRAFIRVAGADWHAAGGQGPPRYMPVERVLQAFDPRGGGTLEPVQGQDDAWFASYGCSAAGTDLCLLLVFEGVAPGALQDRLSLIEARIGWVLAAALDDASRNQQVQGLGLDVGTALLSEAAQARTFGRLANQWIARLETALKPDLVGVCRIRAGYPTLIALSGGGVPKRRSAERAALENLADHAQAKRTASLLDGGALPMQADAAEDEYDALDMLGCERALLLPVYPRTDCAAVVLVLWRERRRDQPDLRTGEAMADLLGRAMLVQLRAHPAPLRRMWNWVVGLFVVLFGRRGLKLKLMLAVLSAVVLIAAFVPTRHAPAFDARLEARDRAIVSAPFEGFLAEAPAQLGDRISPDGLVLALYDNDLRLQLAERDVERDRLDAEAQAAQARRETARVRALEAQRAQVAIEAELLAQKISAARVLAEDTVVVVGGDAWRRVGDRVRLGEPLVELAVPGSLAVRAFVDEGWVADLPEAAPATLLLAAYPDSPVALRLERITAHAEIRDGVNAFTAWLTLDAELPDGSLDGMRGIVRIDAGPTTVLGAYGRGLFRWVRATLWRWS